LTSFACRDLNDINNMGAAVKTSFTRAAGDALVMNMKLDIAAATFLAILRSRQVRLSCTSIPRPLQQRINLTEL
jgi:hypothetical protein